MKPQKAPIYNERIRGKVSTIISKRLIKIKTECMAKKGNMSFLDMMNEILTQEKVCERDELHYNQG